MTNSELNSRIQIRASVTGDAAPPGLPDLHPDADTPRWRRSLLALVDNQIVGVASIAQSPATDSYFCEIDVVASHRRRGIGTRLFAAIHSLTDPGLPVLARAMPSHPLRRAFADSLGYSVLTRCPAPFIDPTTPAAQDWIDRQNLPAGNRTVPLHDQPIQKVGDAWSIYFDWAHRPFGTVHADRIPRMWQEYSNGVDPATSMITLDGADTIVAFSLVSLNAWDGRTFIVAETVHHDQADGSQLLKATVAASLSALAEREIHRVQLEGHTTDPHIPDLVASLPPGDSDPMEILRLDPPRDGAYHRSA